MSMAVRGRVQTPTSVGIIEGHHITSSQTLDDDSDRQTLDMLLPSTPRPGRRRQGQLKLGGSVRGLRAPSVFYRRSAMLTHAKTGGAIWEFLGRKSEQPAPARSSAGGAECTFSLPQRAFGFEVQSGGQSLRGRPYADHPAACRSRRTQIRRQALARRRAARGFAWTAPKNKTRYGRG